MQFIYFDANPGTLQSNPCNLTISGKQIYLEDETVVLTCVALITVENNVCVLDNHVSINWNPNSETIDTTSRNVLLNELILNVTSTLQIPNVDQSNTGVYTCGLTVGGRNVVVHRFEFIVYG